MKRLTIRVDNGLDEIYFSNPSDPEGLYKLMDLPNNEIEKAVHKLAEYEDIGLTPGEIYLLLQRHRHCLAVKRIKK